MIKTNRTRAAVFSASLLILAAGCGDREETVAAVDSETVERGGTAVVADVADINTPVMLLANTVVDGTLASDVLNMELVRGTWENDQLVYKTADQHPMALARRWEYVGPDSSALRFHMRSDARWSDGQPVTAHDIVFTYGLAKNPAVASPRQAYVEHLDSVVAENDSVVTFHFDRRYAEMLSHSALAPMPRHTFEGADPAQIRSHPAILDVTKLPTSGPFRFGSWQKGQSFTLVPNPYSPTQPNLEQVVFRVVPDPTTRVVELQTGAVDFVQNVPSDQIPRLKQQAQQLRFEQEQRRYYDYIAYNPKDFPAFADPEIRQALGLALNVPQMLEALQLSEYAEPAAGPYSPILREVHDPQARPLGFDSARARQILASKGWRDTDGDGILDKDGRPFRFSLVTNAGNQRRADVSQIAQQQWRQIGVDAQLRQIEFNTFMQDVVIGRKYEAALGGWGVGLTPDYLDTHWGAESPYNLAGYSDPQTTRLIEQATAQPTAEAAAPYWRQAAARIAQAHPVTFLYYLDAVDGVSQRLRGVEINSYGPYQNMHEWWIPASQRRGAAAATPAADSTAR